MNDTQECMQINVPHDELQHFRWFGIVIGSLDIVIGGVGNGLTITAFLTNRRLWNTFNIFIVNLSLIDFLTAVFMMPLHVVGYSFMYWPLPRWTCLIQAYIYFCCGYTSVVCLMSITINRLVGIVYPLHYKRVFSNCRVVIVLIACWILSPLFLLPFLLVKNEDGSHMMGWREDQLLCTFNNLGSSGYIHYMQAIRIIFQFIPACVMIICYTVSVLDVSKGTSAYRTKPINYFKSSLTSKSVSTARYSAASSINNEQTRQQRKNNWRLLLISVLMCSVYCLLFIPSVVINLLPNSRCLDPRLHMSCSFITWLNSCANPILYCLLYPRFQREYKRILKHATNRVLNFSTLTNVSTTQTRPSLPSSSI